MHRSLLLFPALVLGHLLLGQTPAAHVPAPAIEFVPTNLVDTLPADSAGRDQRYTLLVRNTGDAPLVIDQVRSSDPCYCDRPPGPILPGGSAKLHVACPPMHGPVRRQTFWIDSNAPGPLQFTLKQVVLPR